MTKILLLLEAYLLCMYLLKVLLKIINLFVRCHQKIFKRIPCSGMVADYYRNKYSPIMGIKIYVSRNNLYISNAGKYNNGQFFAITNLKDI